LHGVHRDVHEMHQLHDPRRVKEPREVAVVVFVTGGSGFVGQALVRALAARGDTVRALSRGEKSDQALRAAGAVPVRGDLESVEESALAGAEVVVHAAAHVAQAGRWEDYARVTVRGTERLLHAASAAGVRRFVHVGTEAALFDGRDLVDVDESAPLALSSPFFYARSKALAERAVREANRPGFATVVIRPRLVWGRGDTSVLPALAAAARAGSFAWSDGGRHLTSTTHLDNLVHALLLATERGRGGEAYFVVDGPPRPLRDFLGRYARAQGVELGDRSLPGWLVRALASVIEPLSLAMGREPPLSRFAAAMTSRRVTVDDRKAREELGYREVITVDEGLERLAARPGA
jgi:hypothetical protein